MVRTVFAIAFFGIAGFVDWRRHPDNPIRLREYGFLLYGAVIAAIYGVLHDQVSSAVSREYFILFKGIQNSPEFRFDVSILAVKASWWVGVVGAAALLVANNASPVHPQLGYSVLRRFALSIIMCAAIGSFLGWATIPGVVNPRIFPGPTLLEKAATVRFLSAWGMNLGSYVGGLVGIVLAVVRTKHQRANLVG